MNKSLIDFVYEILQKTGEQPVSFDEIRELIRQNYTFASEEEELEKIILKFQRFFGCVTNRA